MHRHAGCVRESLPPPVGAGRVALCDCELTDVPKVALCACWLSRVRVGWSSVLACQRVQSSCLSRSPHRDPPKCRQPGTWCASARQRVPPPRFLHTPGHGPDIAKPATPLLRSFGDCSSECAIKWVLDGGRTICRSLRPPSRCAVSPCYRSTSTAELGAHEATVEPAAASLLRLLQTLVGFLRPAFAPLPRRSLSSSSRSARAVFVP